ncbi:MAG: flap endonuclease-1 [Candidatus Altiarchaeota archaeon]|nr:flap endonuclease-1 [Candidatus Altiarchaeota archaeon]
MGVNLKDIIQHRELSFSELKGKTIAVDALNTLYQFLASIRQPDGTPLMDKKGNVTSHLSGIVYRTSNLLKLGIKPVYVFDGEPPELKKKELRKRSDAKKEAQAEWTKAKAEGRLDDALKYAKRTSRLTREMIEDAKKVVEYMGIPIIQAPSEGEAQCALLCNRGDAWAVGSQDYDALLFGAPRLVKGLTMSGKIELNIVDLSEVLAQLNITREQLIDVAILVGTDFDEGVHGIGPKKALKAVQENKLSEIQVDFDMDEVRRLFLNHPVREDYSINWGKANVDGLIDILCKQHDFSEERVKRAVNEIEEAMKNMTQQTMSKWF